MIDIDIKPRAIKVIKSLPAKHKRQVKNYILNLLENPYPNDAKNLAGYKPYLRGDVGEYRVIYRYSKSDNLLTIVLIGKRNGGEIYQKMKRIL